MMLYEYEEYTIESRLANGEEIRVRAVCDQKNRGDFRGYFKYIGREGFVASYRRMGRGYYDTGVLFIMDDGTKVNEGWCSEDLEVLENVDH